MKNVTKISWQPCQTEELADSSSNVDCIGYLFTIRYKFCASRYSNNSMLMLASATNANVGMGYIVSLLYRYRLSTTFLTTKGPRLNFYFMDGPLTRNRKLLKKFLTISSGNFINSHFLKLTSFNRTESLDNVIIRL